MNEKNENKKEIKTSYKDKDGNKYKIEIKEGEEKEIKPEGKDGPKIKVKFKEKSFFTDKFTVNGEDQSKLTTAAYISIAVPLVALVLFGVYFFFFRKKKNKGEEEAL